MTSSVVYTNSPDRRVYLDVPVTPVGDSLEVDVYEQGVRKHTVNEVMIDPGNGMYFNLPFALTLTDRDLEVHWQFQYDEGGTRYEYDAYRDINVVTPILPLKEIRSIVGPSFADEDVTDIERAVRYVIQAHTGQFFGRFVGKKKVTGSGESNLRLPARLMELKSINGNTYWNDALAIRGNGWFLQNKAMGVPPVRADFDGWNEATAYNLRYPIIGPNSIDPYLFNRNMEYTLDGIWGWNTVPAPVQEAARLLVNDYASGDSIYRDRFLTSMTAADWRIQFNDGAFSNTGNVRANQLLAEFVLRRGWMVF